MAMQHLVAFSSTVVGAAIAAGSAYGCGALPGGHLPTGKCYWGGMDIKASVEYIHHRSRQGLIDDPANLKSIPVVIFNGKSDWTVFTQVSSEVQQQLSNFIPADKLVTNFETDAAHVWSLDHDFCYCGRCSVFGSGLCCNVNNCAYDLSGDFLRRSYRTLLPRVKARRYFRWIQQDDYLPPGRASWSFARMAPWAIAYVPTGCLASLHGCRVHVDYHGCIADQWPQRLMWVQNLDLNEYGEANNIVILYPQAKGDSRTGAGCWNWGFPKDDTLFDTKMSAQLLTVMNMLDELPRTLELAQELPFGEGPPSSRAPAVVRGRSGSTGSKEVSFA